MKNDDFAVHWQMQRIDMFGEKKHQGIELPEL